MKKTLVITLTLIFALSLTMGAAAEEITVWGWGVYPDTLEKMADQYQEDHPDATINVELIGWSDMVPRLQAAMSAGTGGPDLATVTLGTHIASFAELGGLTDLSEYVDPISDQFTNAAYAGSRYKDTTYGIPADIGPYTMFYRTDIFEEAGVDPESIKTWEDYIAAGKTIMEETGSHMLPWPTTHYELGNWNFEPALRAAGGNFFDQQGNPIVNKLSINYKVIEVMQKITDSGIGLEATPWTTPWNAAIQNGDVATVLAGGWFIGNITEIAPETSGNWRVMQAPNFTAEAAGSMGGTAMVVPSTSDNVELAVDFAKYVLATKEGTKFLFQDAGVMPAYKPVYETEAFSKEIEFFGGQKVWQKLAEISKKELATWNATPYSTQVFGNEGAPINLQLTRILTDRVELNKGLDKAQEAVVDLME
ncbi:ABC transporter substrate-binding protein [Halanaerobium saccharolyticum]|uniref:ABC transporter substrate-binding protein n=1 Tax=Halanaerobium saccharolyticum TaxID=43595 RepID=UPI00105B4BB5|nr:extracellular solute-binding protein [Halanaerobium saccharolyticum]